MAIVFHFVRGVLTEGLIPKILKVLLIITHTLFAAAVYYSYLKSKKQEKKAVADAL